MCSERVAAVDDWHTISTAVDRWTIVQLLGRERSGRERRWPRKPIDKEVLRARVAELLTRASKRSEESA